MIVIESGLYVGQGGGVGGVYTYRGRCDGLLGDPCSGIAIAVMPDVEVLGGCE